MKINIHKNKKEISKEAALKAASILKKHKNCIVCPGQRTSVN